MDKANILITGANGQLGNALKEVKQQFPLFDMFFATKEQLDITNKSSIEALFQSHNFKYCINAAAYTKVDLAEKEVDLCFEINTAAVQRLAEVCFACNTTLIHISSDYVYHPDHSNILTEDSETNPQSIYAKSKLAGDMAVMSILEKYIILRTSWVYYKSGHNFVNSMIRLSQNHEQLKIVSDQIGSPTNAFDLAKVCLDIINALEENIVQEPYGVYNFSNSGFTNWAEFASEIFLLKDLETQVVKIPTSEYPTPAKRPLNSKMSKAKINAKFQIPLKPWKKALFESLQDNN